MLLGFARRTAFLTLIVVFALSAAGVEAQSRRGPGGTRPKKRLSPNARTMKVIARLGQPVDLVEFDDPFSEVLEWFKQRGIRNLIINWELLADAGVVDQDTTITLSIEDVTVGELLDLVLELASDQATTPQDRLTYHVSGGVLRIAPREYFNDRFYTRKYYVEDLLQRVTANELAPFIAVGSEFSYVREVRPTVGSGAAAQAPIVDTIQTGTAFGPGSPGIGITGGGIAGGGGGGGAGGAGGGGGGGSGGSGGGGGGFGPPDYEEIRAEELENLMNLLRTLRPETWDDGGGRGTIVAFGEYLIITQNIEMHEIIGGTFKPMQRARKRP